MEKDGDASNMFKWKENPATLLPYTPPDWASHLNGSPTVRIKLFQPMTPIHMWKIPGLPDDVELYIKRDDMTGAALTGNKVRKLEFLLAEALASKCNAVITCGAVLSNHCRTTAVAAGILGLEAHLLLRSKIKNPEDIVPRGNVLLNRLVGAQQYLIPNEANLDTEIVPRMQILAKQLSDIRNIKSYLIPVGKPSTTAVQGYLWAWQELLDQGIQERFDDVIVTIATGENAAGLAIGNYLTGSKLKNNEKIGLKTHTDRKETKKKRLYAYWVKYTHFLKDFIRKVAMTTGVLLDPTYTGKAASGMSHDLTYDRSKFQGNRILFIHTGGIFGLYDGRMTNILSESRDDQSQMKVWMDLADDPIPVPADKRNTNGHQYQPNPITLNHHFNEDMHISLT
ncbi:bifunctional D-cysteine desulfhydrase/1-aminocyclopropane-1-carboxylate deaminase, mitochondrial-like [Anneissia japonica]|uniref:bifunctional D-cysteine desulfhydrase/1-aminocyclopropane-1-carboxylate deaminase, mitochondrial-like n=1 Tax=Anneissia japonica TaxID=1529436 RepID=UPI001425B1B5|nr:bifunctional D-cysteine desulfhydrase/1-aminocyclopropane-1-carboxylate deaminase, mitochondrial-like [Anneissia japonica]